MKNGSVSAPSNSGFSTLTIGLVEALSFGFAVGMVAVVILYFTFPFFAHFGGMGMLISQPVVAAVSAFVCMSVGSLFRKR